MREGGIGEGGRGKTVCASKRRLGFLESKTQL